MWNNSRVFRKRVLVIVLASTVVPFFFLLFSTNEENERMEKVLSEELAELRQRVQHAEMLDVYRKRDMSLLSMFMNKTISNRGNVHSEELLELTRLLLNPNQTQNVRAPSIYSFLPHLLNDPSSMIPAFSYGQGKPFVSMVLGLPTVKRESQSYLLPTLASLLECMNEDEKNQTLIIVFIAETDTDYVNVITEKIKKKFKEALDRGLIEIIAPPASFYPNLDGLKKTLGDPMERIKWRTKQNFDYAFLMMYAQSRGTYYVQLEDDILTTKGFVSTMKDFALKKNSLQQDWFLLDFCQLGFIGKMFRSTDLPFIIQYAIMFHNDKPVDWLIDPLLETKFCPHDAKKCKQIKAGKWIHYKPSLFQHVGTTSSLKGKVQKLKDKQFGKLPLFTPHTNPEAEIISPIKSYKQFSIERAYQGKSFFWGLTPEAGDTIIFNFAKPVALRGFRIRSGNYEHPSDLMYNATIEVRPNNRSGSFTHPRTADRYLVIGVFDDLGIAEGSWDFEKYGPVDSLRMTLQQESKNWVIISEIFLDVAS